MKEGALPELPGGWVWTRLGEIGTINPKTNGENIEDDTEVTFLPMRCVEELTGSFDLSLTKRFKEVKKGYTPFVDGDLIFAKITPCMENGKIAIVQGLKNGMGFGSTEFHVIRLSKIIPGKFFFYFLVREELRKDAKRNMTGSAGQLRVSTSYMQQIIFPLPPLPEQRAIVSKIEQLFSDLDNGINNFKKAQAQLKLYRQSVLKAACEGKLVPTEAELARAEKRDYEPADMLLARILKERREKWNGKGKYKETVAPDTSGLSVLPEGWCFARLWDVTVRIGDVDHKMPRA
jgi:type I restriction enzyme S subunit